MYAPSSCTFAQRQNLGRSVGGTPDLTLTSHQTPGAVNMPSANCYSAHSWLAESTYAGTYQHELHGT